MLLEISTVASCPGETTTRVTYLSMKIHLKRCYIFPLKFAVILFSGSGKGCTWRIVVTWLRLLLRLHTNTSNPDVYWRKRPNWLTHLELCHRNSDILEKMLHGIALSHSTVGKCTPMEVIKQPEDERTLTTKEQKWSSFQTNFD